MTLLGFISGFILVSLYFVVFLIGMIAGAIAFANYVKKQLREQGIDFTPEQSKPLTGDEWKQDSNKDSEDDEWLKDQLGD